ncbi:MAG: o-succinylbenzoate--CoA ligase [Candidatus Endonucleobacter bathymodioli]|uniref:O-succinylbenzoate--CoA ligase n=1 Tax=Candidatus Endonucleibacter bathymodioli TaxID=539814 RepID=A0AA90NNW7_9GAMM|nr:o-succinylbenzoate--CoA ligase [Candidatus Endonucleobacter bathymodioli]
MGRGADVRACPLRHLALEYSDHIIIQEGAQSYSAVLLDTWVTQYQKAMEAQGVVVGDRVVVLALDSLDTILLMIACMRSCVIFCPVDPKSLGSHIHNYCLLIKAKWLCQILEVFDDQYAGCHYLHLPIRTVVPLTSVEPVIIDPEIIMDLIATSGTTNAPKAVAHNFSNYYHSVAGAKDILALGSQDAWLLSLPLFHVSGVAIVFRCLLAGAKIIIYDKSKGLLSNLLQTTVTHLSLVHTQLYRLLELESVDFRTLGVRNILLGGGMVSGDLVKKAQRNGVRVITTYGLTEMSSQVCAGTPQFVGASVSSGSILKYRELMFNNKGDIMVRGKTLAMGYYRNGYLQKITDNQGWYHTGDKGQWYGDQILIKGRSDNMIVFKGENIHPEEIEQVLMELPGIVQAVVVGVDSVEFGQIPIAYVQSRNGTLDELVIKQQLVRRIAHFKIPFSIVLFPEIDTSSGIKLSRRLFQKFAEKQFPVAEVANP